MGRTQQWSGWRQTPSGWSAAASIAGPSPTSGTLGGLTVPLQGADVALIRLLAVGTAGGASLGLSIAGVNEVRSASPATIAAPSGGMTTIYEAQPLASFLNLSIGATPVANAWNRTLANYYDTISAESLTGSPVAARRKAFDQVDGIGVHSTPGSGIAEIALGECVVSGYDHLSIGLALLQVSGTVNEFTILYNLRNAGIR